ncbi:UNVERIFIED_CONTAM: hypothetical protein Sradi_3853700 [Sesamum radiatum]|uniref:Uncharacterized protein n=1 Tax=Sesamum radiatum TaxID=300843 RepID=A0AAW2Q1U3_SESRA
MEARLGACPSYTWQSVFASRDIIAVGIRWQVGNGNSIAIWGHPWLPRSVTFQLLERPATFPEDRGGFLTYLGQGVGRAVD